MSKKTAIINIGRNVGDTPMSDYDWGWFRADLKGLIVERGGFILATNLGETASGDWGTEEGYWIVCSIDPNELKENTLSGNHNLRYFLGLLATTNGQDAIAVTIGDTIFVEGN